MALDTLRRCPSNVPPLNLNPVFQDPFLDPDAILPAPPVFRGNIRSASSSTLAENAEDESSPLTGPTQRSRQTSSPHSRQKSSSHSRSGSKSSTSGLNATTTGPIDTFKSLSKALWTPWILTTESFSGLIFAFAVLLVLLEMLSFELTKKRGLHTTDTASRFLWTYGPSFFMVLIATYWFQMEYRVRQLTPWKEMSKGNRPASRSILLDYTSPWRLKAIWIDSLKARHFAVLLAAAGSLLLKLLIIAWTGPLLFKNWQTSPNVEIKPATLRASEACLALLIIITISLTFLRPAGAVPRDPSTLAGLATIMGQSSAFTTAMQGLGALPLNRLRRYVSESRYRTVVSESGGQRHFCIQADSIDDESASGSGPIHSSQSAPSSWWNPITNAICLVVLALMVGVIVGLELLYQRSKTRSGLADATSSSAQYKLAYWPGAVMLVVCAAYNFVDYCVRILQPYDQLRKYPSPASPSIQVNYLAKFAPHALFDAARRRHWAVVATSLGSMLAPLLVVVASGLYTIHTLDPSSKVNIRMLDDFDLTTPPSSYPPDAMYAATSAVLTNTSFVPWTWGPYAFPRMNLASPSNSSTYQNSTVEIRTPILSANLNCSRVPSSAVKIWTTIPFKRNATAPESSARNIAVPVAKGCGNLCNGTEACSRGQDYTFVPDGSHVANTTYFGRIFPTKSDPAPPGWNDNCPHITVVYGMNADNGGSLNELIALNCYPSVSFSESLTNFTLPDFNITSSTPIARSSHTMSRGDIATIDLNRLILSSQNSTQNIGIPLPILDFDTAFTAAINNGRSPIPLSSIFTASQENILTFDTALSNIYSIAYASYLSSTSRVSLSSSSPLSSTTLNGTLYYSSSSSTTTATSPPRIVQSAIATRLLEALLACLSLTLIASTITLDSRRILPNNPSSIAVQASLIADSELMRNVPRGAEFWSEREIERAGVFDGFMYSLGGWVKREGSAATSGRVIPGLGRSPPGVGTPASGTPGVSAGVTPTASQTDVRHTRPRRLLLSARMRRVFGIDVGIAEKVG